MYAVGRFVSDWTRARRHTFVALTVETREVERES